MEPLCSSSSFHAGQQVSLSTAQVEFLTDYFPVVVTPDITIIQLPAPAKATSMVGWHRGEDGEHFMFHDWAYKPEAPAIVRLNRLGQHQVVLSLSEWARLLKLGVGERAVARKATKPSGVPATKVSLTLI